MSLQAQEVLNAPPAERAPADIFQETIQQFRRPADGTGSSCSYATFGNLFNYFDA